MLCIGGGGDGGRLDVVVGWRTPLMEAPVMPVLVGGVMLHRGGGC